MNILYLLVPAALLLAAAGVAGFLWSVRSGQYDDVHTPALRMLLDDEDLCTSKETRPGRTDS
ncbi:MAG: hypothetical protein KatS3mg042_1251 [Rhodothermaceae bacterium]|nr:MAG: hypothetical protein KatS3mg042_1251 [Rhodothermaceae bacterium]